jgi:hypothetical protein
MSTFSTRRSFQDPDGSTFASTGIKIELALQVQPKLLRRSEKSTESESGVRAHTAFLDHDLVDVPRRHTDVLRETILAYPQGLHEFLKQDFTGVHWAEFPHGSTSLMVINDLNIWFNEKSAYAITHQEDNHCATNRESDETARVSQKIDGKHGDGEPTTPVGSHRETDSREETGDSNNTHEQNRPAPDTLK